MIDDREIDNLLTLAHKATDGPWMRDPHNGSAVVPAGRNPFTPDDPKPFPIGIDRICTVQVSSVPNCMDNARYLAAVDPQTITSLIARLRDAERQRDVANARFTEVERQRDDFQRMWKDVVENHNALVTDCARMERELNEARKVAAWEWFGLPGHFICVDRCYFRLHTRVNKKRVTVSTIGEFYPDGLKGKMEAFDDGKMFYETYVADEYGEIDGKRYATINEAQAGHLAFCRKYDNEHGPDRSENDT